MILTQWPGGRPRGRPVSVSVIVTQRGGPVPPANLLAAALTNGIVGASGTGFRLPRSVMVAQLTLDQFV